MLTENREEIEIKIQDDDMTETAKDIGLLVGDDDPRLSQTMVAAREAEAQRAARRPFPPASAWKMHPTASQRRMPTNLRKRKRPKRATRKSPRRKRHRVPQLSLRPNSTPTPALRGSAAARRDDVLDADVLEDDAPPAEEEGLDEGYVLEDEDAEVEEDEGLGPLGGGDEDF